MGLLDVVFGRRKMKAPAPDRLFAMATGQVTLTEQMGLKPRGEAAIVFQPLATADFQAIVRDMEEVVSGTSSDAGTRLESRDDEYGFRWMVLRDEDFDDIVVGINAVSGALVAGGYGERILAAVFAFERAGGGAVYWIYNYKRGTFYPFVPRPGQPQARDNEAELRLKAQLDREMPIEPELERWFPLWGVPV